MNTRKMTECRIRRLVSGTTAAASLILAVAVLGGCKSTGYVKSDSAAWQLQEAAGGVRGESRDIDATTGALNDLVNSPSGDLKVQFTRFSRALDRLDASSKKAGGKATHLEQKRTASFEVWDKQLGLINDEDLRKQSEARKAEVSSQYETTTRQYQQVQEALVPLIDLLKDIRKALSTDLTTAGLRSMQPNVNTVNDKARNVQAQLAQSATDLDALGAKMSSFAVQSAK